MDYSKKYMNIGKKSASNVTEFAKKNPIKTALYIILFITIFFVIIWLVKYLFDKFRGDKKKMDMFNGHTIIGSPADMFYDANRDKKDNVVNTSFSLPRPNEGLAFSYSFWIYIQNWDWQFGKWKNILVKGNPGNSGKRAPGFWLYPRTNALHLRVSTTIDNNEGCDIRNIPLQKWVHVVYVLNNRSVDVYIDGKLERSCVLKGIPIINNKDLIVAADGMGFYGKISALNYYTNALKPNQVTQLYRYGPYV